MAKRFSNRHSKARPGGVLGDSPHSRTARVIGVLFGIAALALAIRDRDHVLYPEHENGTFYVCLGLLIVAAYFIIQRYTEIDCDEQGITIVHGRGRGRRIPWVEITDADWTTEKHWIYGKHPRLKVSRILSLRLRTGPPLVLRNMGPQSELESLLNARTRPRPAPEPMGRPRVTQDGTIHFDPARGKAPIVACVAVIFLLAATSGYFAPSEATDPDRLTWSLALTLLSGLVLSSVALLLARDKFLKAAYTLKSSGDTFAVVRRKFGNERTTTGEWSRISETRYQIEKGQRQRDFIVSAGQPEPLVFREAEYPGLVAWFNERAPLNYEWIPVASIGQRRVLERIGDYARVAKAGSALGDDR